MKKLFIPAFMVAMLGFASCADDEASAEYVIASDNEAIEVEAVISEEGADFDGLSKTCLTDAYKYNFVGDEQMAMFHNKSKTKSILKNTLGTQGTSAKFSGTVTSGKSATKFYGIIPATAALRMDQTGYITVKIPTEQTAIEGTFDPTAHIYSSYSTKATTYSFKTVNSFLMIQNDEENTKRDFVKIIFKAKGNEVHVAGDYIVNSSAAEISEPCDNLSSEITLNGDVKADKRYFIGLAPVSMNGYTLEAYTANGEKYVCEYNDAITFAKNGIKRIIPKWQYDGGDLNVNLNDLQWNTELFAGAKKVVFANKTAVSDNIASANTTLLVKNNRIGIYVNNTAFNGDKLVYVVAEKDETIYLTGSLSSMFANSGVKVLEFNNVNTEKVECFDQMFENCADLKTIFATAAFAVANNATSDNMFAGCAALVGGNGTKLAEVEPVVNGSMAKVDAEGEGNAGYFTAVGADPWTEPAYPAATFNPSFAYGLCMYYGLSTPKKIVFDTKKDAYDGLYRVKVGGNDYFADSKNYIEVYTNIEGGNEYYFLYDGVIACDDSDVFSESCWSSVGEIVFNNYNTENATSMNSYFRNCGNLTTLDLSGFKTSKVTDMNGMFAGCSNLKTIYVGDEFVLTNVSTSFNMFDGCTSLVGEKGTIYNEAKVDDSYAHVDGGEGNRGYFTLIGHPAYSGNGKFSASRKSFDNSGWINNPDEPYLGN